MFRYNFRQYGNDKLNRGIDACVKAKVGLIAMKTQGSEASFRDAWKKFEKSGKWNKYQAVLGAKPQGTTDTERVFYYLLGRMQAEHGTLDAGRIGSEALADTFAKVVREIIDESRARTDNRQRGLSTDPKLGNPFSAGSRLQTAPACNFVLTNGDILLASAYRHGLFLGVHETPDGRKEYMLASEKIQPRQGDPADHHVPARQGRAPADRRGELHEARVADRGALPLRAHGLARAVAVHVELQQWPVRDE